MSNVENKKDINLEDKKDLRNKTFKKKWEFTDEELSKWSSDKKKEVVFYKNKYKACFAQFDIVPYLTITERIDIADYYMLTQDGKLDESTESVKVNTRFRFLEGVSATANKPYYVVELIPSKNVRLSFFIKDKVIRALQNANKKIDFEKIEADEKEFGIKEIEIN